MSATTVRKFGTDVSNIPKKDLSAKKAFKKSTPKSGDGAAKNTMFVQKSQPKELLIEEAVDDEIFIKSSPLSLKSQSVTDFPFRYERDFLLSFQEFCTEPLEGLIPEVLPGYVNPELDVSNEFSSLSIHPLSRSAPSLKLKKLSSSADEALASPYGGVVFKPFKAQDSAGSPGRLSVVIPPVSADEIAPLPIALDFNTPIAVRSQSLPCTPTSSSDLQPTVLSLEWRVKKVKKTKPREGDPRRLAARQKQIDIGMNTPGFVRFMETVPAEQRTKDHPRVPDIHQVCSKRSWDGQVRKWRRMLHDYDPEEAGKSRTLDDSDKENDSQSDKEDFSDEEEIHGIEAQISA